MSKQNKNIGKSQTQGGTITRFNIIFIDLQLFLTFFTIGLLIWYLFDHTIIYIFQLFLGITLLVMGYNNQIIYHKKNFTLLYLIIGLFLLILDLIMFIGVK